MGLPGKRGAAKPISEGKRKKNREKRLAKTAVKKDPAEKGDGHGIFWCDSNTPVVTNKKKKKMRSTRIRRKGARADAEQERIRRELAEQRVAWQAYMVESGQATWEDFADEEGNFGEVGVEVEEGGGVGDSEVREEDEEDDEDEDEEEEGDPSDYWGPGDKFYEGPGGSGGPPAMGTSFQIAIR